MATLTPYRRRHSMCLEGCLYMLRGWLLSPARHWLVVKDSVYYQPTYLAKSRAESMKYSIPNPISIISAASRHPVSDMTLPSSSYQEMSSISWRKVSVLLSFTVGTDEWSLLHKFAAKSSRPKSCRKRWRRAAWSRSGNSMAATGTS